MGYVESSDSQMETRRDGDVYFETYAAGFKRICSLST